MSIYGPSEFSPGLDVTVDLPSNAYLLYVILIPVLVVVLIITVLASSFIYVKYKATTGPDFAQNIIYHNIVSYFIIHNAQNVCFV